LLLKDDSPQSARVALGCFAGGCGVSTAGRF
jgi:hypothetical protein